MPFDFLSSGPHAIVSSGIVTHSMSTPRAVVLGFIIVVMHVVVAAGDVVHLRDGSQLQGRLTSCDETSCTLHKRKIDRTNIVRITLGSATNVAPAGTTGVVLTDGTVKTGQFTGLISSEGICGDTTAAESLRLCSGNRPAQLRDELQMFARSRLPEDVLEVSLVAAFVDPEPGAGLRGAFSAQQRLRHPPLVPRKTNQGRHRNLHR
jgi:hypothetical protein